MTNPHVLILGGTTEARALGERLSTRGGIAVTLSLAGRTAKPLPQAGSVRSGGFGGPDGLTAFLRREGIDLLVDATHPYAARISANAQIAASMAAIPLVTLERPRWRPLEGDRWIHVASVEDAAARIGPEPRSVFLAIGRQELVPFRGFRQHAYLVRSVDPVEPEAAPHDATFVRDRGPFGIEEERRLFDAHLIDTVISKNSGGEATYAKITVARERGLPVIMVDRPADPVPGAAETVDEAMAQIAHALGLPVERGE